MRRFKIGKTLIGVFVARSGESGTDLSSANGVLNMPESSCFMEAPMIEQKEKPLRRSAPPKVALPPLRRFFKLNRRGRKR